MQANTSWPMSPAAGVWSSDPTTCRPSWRSPSASPTAACSGRPVMLCAAGSATTPDTNTWSWTTGAHYRAPRPRHAGAHTHLSGTKPAEECCSLSHPVLIWILQYPSVSAAVTMETTPPTTFDLMSSNVTVPTAVTSGSCSCSRCLFSWFTNKMFND